jgi:peptide-methionine (R)-S-oxide reductase
VSYNKLTPEEEKIIVHKETEVPFIGEYDNFFQEGTFICKRCNAPLFSSKSKFDAGCGWPAFDDTLTGGVHRVPDPDGIRTEIECATCGAHLGHEFVGERLTAKNTRECVNSTSIRFVPKEKELPKIIHEQQRK